MIHTRQCFHTASLSRPGRISNSAPKCHAWSRGFTITRSIQ